MCGLHTYHFSMTQSKQKIYNLTLRMLQDPEEALSVLVPDTAGNKVNWVEALRQGQIEPRASLYGDVERRQRRVEVKVQTLLVNDPTPGVTNRNHLLA